MDGDFKTFGFETAREDNTGFRLLRQIHIEHGIATVAVKMAVLAHIGAEPGGAAVELHLAHEAALDEGVEAIIDGGHGDVRHAALGADEDLLRRGVVAFLQQHLIDVLALGRGAQPPCAEPFGQASFR